MVLCDGSRDILAIVDAIEANPNILVDFNASPLFFEMDSFSTPPPENKGPIYLASSHEGRVVEFDVSIKPDSQDDGAFALQKLNRLISKGDQWLVFQRADATSPVFFLLRRSNIVAITDWLAIPKGQRSIHLAIPADPFAYGLKVTGTEIISNSPVSGIAASGGNPMMMEMPEIEGDVLTPLVLEFPTADALHKIQWASEAVFDDDFVPGCPESPYYMSLSASPLDSTPPSGWSAVDTAWPGFISGVRRRITHGTYASIQPLFVPTEAVLQPWPGLPRGDYRVMARVGNIEAGDELLFWNRPPISGSVLVYEEAAARTRIAVAPSVSTSFDWFDLGIVAMPGGAPQADPTFELGETPDDATPLWNFGIYHEGDVGVSFLFDLDVIMLIPAGRPKTLTRHGYAMFSDQFTDKQVTIDGVNASRSISGESALAPGYRTRGPAIDLGGAAPIVVPGACNTVTFFADVAIGEADRVADDMTLTTELTWSYYPRYVYDRGPST